MLKESKESPMKANIVSLAARALVASLVTRDA